MSEDPVVSPIQVHPPLLSSKTGGEILEYIQQKTGAPGVVVILLTKRMDSSTPEQIPSFSTTFTCGVEKKFLAGLLAQIASRMTMHPPGDLS